MIFVSFLGRLVISFLTYLGELVALAQEVVKSLIIGKFRWHQLMKQIVEIGFKSQVVVIVTGAFTGSVLTAQALFQMQQFKMETMGGALVGIGMLRELGPTITGLMLSGRVGAAMAAEIGTMKVTEQIDALRSMDVHPVDYLVTPRFLAMAISIPLLIAESVGFGILSSVFIGTEIFGVPFAYWNFHLEERTEMVDIIISMIKGGAFGMIIVLISCHQGMKATNGAVGVGRGTTNAMVYSSLGILIVNFFLTMLLNIFFPISFGS
jgi:phospholipid/cholesterol/gamma-HCH transport system permease protein